MNNKKAFTLVELIVVITILAILGTIAFISLQGYSKSSRDSVRISDVSNMKTALELFHLNAGKYPLPDDDQEVTFSGNTLWYQGEFGTTVISQLSRNINEVPTDPLTDKTYIYSVANNKNEFEILTLLESDLTLNSIKQTNAATYSFTPRIDGTFNGVFIITRHHIVPVPSIINSEVGDVELLLNENNIKSQVVSNGGNIPNHGNVNYSTGELNGLILSVYTGSLDKTSDDSEKELAMKAIQDAYTGSVLASDIKYANILSKTETEDIVALFNTIVLGDSTIKIVSVSIPTTIADCTGLNEPVPFSAITIYLGCDIEDIIVCSGNGMGITIAGCNVGATTGSEYDLCIDESSCTAARVGGYFQFGRNNPYPTWTSGTVGVSYDWETIGWIDGIDDGSANYWGVFEDDKSTTTYSNPLGSTNIGLMKGPCEIGYHVPTNQEWNDIYTAGDWVNSGGNIGDNIKASLKMPLAGYRVRSDAHLIGQGGYGHYYSSSPDTTKGYRIMFYDNIINTNASAYRSNLYPIRCFKN